MTRWRITKDEDRVRVEMPELRIIEDNLWFKVQSLFASREWNESKLRGRPPRHLLTGIARCGTCGGPMNATHGRQGKENIPVYMCAWHRARGPEVCPSSLRRPLTKIHEVVLGWCKEAVTPSVALKLIEDVVRRRRAEGAKSVGNSGELVKELSRTQREVDRLVNALAKCDDKPEAIIHGIACAFRKFCGIFSGNSAVYRSVVIIES